MENEITNLVKRIEVEITKTPTGELRNLLCDANITIRTLSVPSIIDVKDLEPDFINALNLLIKTQKQPKKERFK